MSRQGADRRDRRRARDRARSPSRRGRPRRRRAGRRLRLDARRRLRPPVYVEDAPGGAEAAVRGRAAGHDQGPARRQDCSTARSSTSATGSATAASRDCSRSRSTPATRATGASTSTTSTGPGNIEVDGFERKSSSATRADEGSRSKVIEIPHRSTRTTTAASSSSAPTACCTSAPATAAAAATPTATPRTDSLLGKLLRIDPRKRAAATRSRTRTRSWTAGGDDEIYALGLRNPYRFSFDGKTGDICIGDVGQDAWEEIDHVGPPALGGANFGWDMLRGRPPVRGARRARRTTSRRSSSTRSRRRQLRGHRRLRRPRPAAAGARGPLPLRRLLRRRVRSFDPPGTRAPPTPPPASALHSRSSFGEGGGGSIYVASLGGAVYRHRPAVSAASAVTVVQASE